MVATLTRYAPPMAQTRILIIEDERALTNVLAYNLEREGFEVTVAHDGSRSFPLTEGYVTNAPIADVRKAIEAAYLPPDKGIHHYSPIVVNTGAKLILIDTGFGPASYTQTKGELGQLQTNLAAAGIKPQDVIVRFALTDQEAKLPLDQLARKHPVPIA